MELVEADVTRLVRVDFFKGLARTQNAVPVFFQELFLRHYPVLVLIQIIECVAHLFLRDRRVEMLQKGTQLVKAHIPRFVLVD